MSAVKTLIVILNNIALRLTLSLNDTLIDRYMHCLLFKKSLKIPIKGAIKSHKWKNDVYFTK
jgi:hypothetical protein